MAWRQIIAWLYPPDKPPVYPPMPLTLVTLTACPRPSSVEEIAFYGDAELAALSEWSRAGRLLLAFMATDREELILVCADPIEAMRNHVAELPMVAAGLAAADLRQVMSMRLGNDPIVEGGASPTH